MVRMYGSTKVNEKIGQIAGFDDLDAALNLSPTLTSVAQPYSQICKIAVENLIKENFNIKKKLPVKLIKRDSVKKIKYTKGKKQS